MKKAVILHGTDGSSNANWFPWLKTQLEDKNYEVWVPNLPNNHTPNSRVYNEFLFSSDWDFTENLIIGHSSGAVSTLNLLADDRCPSIDTAVLVGVWARMDETDLDRDQFKDLFPENNWNFEKIKSKAKNFLFLHGRDDPWCPLEQAEYLCKELDGKIKIIDDGQHFSVANDPKWKELPQLMDWLEHNQVFS